MKFDRIIKTVFLVEFIKALTKATIEIFKPKKTINYPFEKGSISPRFRENMLLEDIQMERKGV